MGQPGSYYDRRILVVDDNQENVDLVYQLLTFSGYANVQPFTRPNEAIAVIQTSKPDLLLLDLHMPETSGFDILRTLGETLSSEDLLPVVVFSADWTSDARKRAFDLGAYDFITKPFDAIELLARVRNFLRMKQMHDELRQRNQTLAESNRALIEGEQLAKAMALELTAANRELEGFTHTVSHDLRGPLRAIQSTSLMLLEDCAEKLTKDEVSLLDSQARNAKRISMIIDEILKLSRVAHQELKPETLVLTDIALEVAEELKVDAAGGVRLSVAPGLEAKGDPLLIRLALWNLIGNAVKFSPEGGVVEVGALQKGADRVYFVRDHGVGFDMAHAGRLFEPFERLVKDTEFPGNGIGLSNVKRIVERHGGQVWAESEPGNGATFFFTLSS